MALNPKTIEAMEAHFDESISMQRAKLLKLAERLRPNVSLDDMLSPHDFPELIRDPNFNFEDGVLGGLIQAQIGLRSKFFRDQKTNDAD